VPENDVNAHVPNTELKWSEVQSRGIVFRAGDEYCLEMFSYHCLPSDTKTALATRFREIFHVELTHVMLDLKTWPATCRNAADAGAMFERLHAGAVALRWRLLAWNEGWTPGNYPPPNFRLSTIFNNNKLEKVKPQTVNARFPLVCLPDGLQQPDDEATIINSVNKSAMQLNGAHNNSLAHHDAILPVVGCRAINAIAIQYRLGHKKNARAIKDQLKDVDTKPVYLLSVSSHHEAEPMDRKGALAIAVETGRLVELGSTGVMNAQLAITLSTMWELAAWSKKSDVEEGVEDTT
jgi:hypothetical protein